jgi:hypothetical protein
MGTFTETVIVDKVPIIVVEEHKRPFSVSLCSKQTEVCRYHLPFAENTWKLSFSISFVFRLRNSRNVETWRNGDIKRKEVQAIFLNPFTVCSSRKRKFDVCPFVDKETNRSNPFANRLNGLTHL